MLLSLNAAQQANINQGIVASITILNLVIVTSLSYWLFNEKISVIQVVGIFVVIAAVITLSCTAPETPIDIGHDVMNKGGGMLMVAIYAIITALSISFEIMCNQWLRIHRNVPGDVTGTYFLLFEGALGTVCLVILTLMGGGVHELSLASFGFLILAAVFLFIAIILANYTISIGIAGVVLAILNTNAAIHVVLSSLFLSQDISSWQIAAVVVTIVGACMVSLGDIIFTGVKSM